MRATLQVQRILAAVGVLLVCYAQIGLVSCVSAELPSRAESSQAESDEADKGRFQLFSRNRSDDNESNERNNQIGEGVRETVGNIAETVTQYTAPTGNFWTTAREQISAPTYQQLIALTAGVCIAALCAIAASSVLA